MIIRLNPNSIVSTDLSEFEKECYKKSIMIAERFINTSRAQEVFAKLGTDLNEMIRRAANVKYNIRTDPRALSSIDKLAPREISLNKIFFTRLNGIASRKQKTEQTGQERQADDDERAVITFVIAMAIVHEFGHLSMQWRPKEPEPKKPEPKKPEPKKPGETIPSSPDSFSTPKRNARELRSGEKFIFFSTPDECKEAGRYVERKLFGKKLGIACQGGNPQKWSAGMRISGKYDQMITNNSELKPITKSLNKYDFI